MWRFCDKCIGLPWRKIHEQKKRMQAIQNIHLNDWFSLVNDYIYSYLLKYFEIKHVIIFILLESSVCSYLKITTFIFLVFSRIKWGQFIPLWRWWYLLLLPSCQRDFNYPFRTPASQSTSAYCIVALYYLKVFAYDLLSGNE